MVREISEPVDYYCVPPQADDRKHWAVILAGGDGVRLRSLSRMISGDDRPKQFCPIFGDHTLLAHTRNRLSGLFETDKTLFVVTKAHESYYSEELSDVDPKQVAVQPLNRGTGAAIAFALTQIINDREGDPADPIVAFFPSDHFYTNENHFSAAIQSAMDAAARHSESIVLLGAESTHPETEYGWIETVSTYGGRASDQVHRVSRFWEKPSRETAQTLHQQGCLWNTFVMVGHASAFLRALVTAAPELMRSFEAARRFGNAADAYLEDLDPVDFSRQVLSRCVAQLLVARMPASVGWSDLGAPERVLETLARTGLGSRQMSLRALYTPNSVAAVA